MTDETKFLPVAGTLFIPGLDNSYYLLKPGPIRKADDWFSDDMNMFYVVSDFGGVPTHVIVKGPFVIDHRTAGTTVEVSMKKQEEEADEISSELEAIFQPAYEMP